MVALASPAVLQAVRAAEPSSSAPAAALARGGGAAPRAAICFFGLMRSVEFTKDSIRNNIFDELTRHGWAYDVLLHTYHMHHYHNPRSREANVSLDVDAWRLLHPARHILEPPEANAAAIEAEVLAYLKHGDPWGEDEPHRSMHNVLMQLHSIERVTQLWEDDGTYDVVLYLRPDQWYFNRLNMSHVEAARSQRDAVYVPFYAWEAGGINDRVALGHPAAMKVYGNRKRGLAAYVAQGNNDMHAERYARRALEAAGIRVLKTNLHAERVRANGVLWGAPRRGRDGGLDGFPPLNTRAHYRMVRDPLLGSSWRALRCNATLKC